MPYPDSFTSSVSREALGSWYDPCDPPPARPLTADEQTDLRTYAAIAARLRAIRDDCRSMRIQGPTKDLADWLPSDCAIDLDGLIQVVAEAISTIESRPERERDEEQLAGWADAP